MADITTVSDGIQMTYTYLNNDFGSSNYSPAALFKSVNTFYIGVLQNDHMHSGHTYQRVTSENLDIYTSTDNKGHPEFNACYKGVNIMINNPNVGVDTNNNVVLDTSTIKFTFRLDNYDNKLDEDHHFDGPIKEIDTSEVGKVKYGFFYLKDYGNNPRMIILAEYGLLTAEDRANNKVSLKLAYAMLSNTVYETGT